MKQMSPELLKEYLLNPLATDEKVRNTLDLPDNRYYTVSIWPVAGIVTVNKNFREVKVKKISKSDQK